MFLTVYHDGGDVVAFDIVEHYDVDGGSLGFVLLSYLGVSEEFQGLGLGSSILSSLVSRFAHKNFLLEAESRQARWYSKNGFVAFPISYASPSFECDSSVPMSLMVYSVERRDALFSLGTMVGVVTSLYRHGYGLAENDRRLVDVLCSVRAEFL